MKNNNKLLFFFGDYWDEMWRRRQQLAWNLAQAGLVEHVAYIERPVPITSFLKFPIGLADRDATSRLQRLLKNHSWVMPVGENLSVLTTFSPLPPLGFAFLFKISESVRDYWLFYYLRRHFEIENPIVWITHPQISLKVIQAMKPCILWYDCTEDFTAWPGLSDCVKMQMQITDKWLTEHADVITAVSRSLYEEKSLINSNTIWLPNAVDADLFLDIHEEVPVPLELKGVSHPILTFIGGLSEWAHDWDLLDKIATLRPEWTILLIGGLSVGSTILKMLDGHSNILCLGQRPYQELPAYLIHSDLCFLFYRLCRKNNTGNSQKLFLYLASGKPVISTRSADMQTYSEYVSLVDNPTDFVAAVEEALRNDSPDKVRFRKKMARENSWDARIKQISQILDNIVKTKRIGDL